MQVLSFTEYVAADPTVVRDRLTHAPAGAAARIDVAEVGAGVSAVTVKLLWDGTDEQSRRDGTLGAFRQAASIFDCALAA